MSTPDQAPVTVGSGPARSSRRNYIGLACSAHDPALAIVNAQGEVVFAEAAERYLQNKRAYCSPPDDVHRCAELIREHCDAGAELVLVKSWSRRWYARERLLAAVLGLLRRARAAVRYFWPRGGGAEDRPVEEVLEMLFAWPGYYWQAQLNSTRQASLNCRIQPALLNRGVRNPMSVRRVNHHLCHAVAGCLTSPFEEAVCAILDGYGEGTSTAYYHYRKGQVRPLRGARRSNVGSLGLYYELLCQLCGFDSLKGEEWKVMGLAAYGAFDRRVYGLLRPLVRVKGLRVINRFRTAGLDAVRRRPGAPALEAADLAFTGQQVFEEAVGEVLTNLHRLGASDNLVYGGGCALNSAWNGKLLEAVPFRRLHVFAAPGDDGNAVGAALAAYLQDHPSAERSPRLQSPFLGSALSPRALGNLAQLGRLERLEHLPGEVCRRAAQLLASGKILGWAQGRAEFGPRALGNRSILADPRSEGVKDRLNALVKFREEFRPFAPAILHESGPEYFEHYQMSPYMERTLRFKPEAARRVPGVVHVNGTGRVQSVTPELNEKFYLLLRAFYELTGVPVLLNTSFNVMGKPIIHSVEDAVAVFYTTGLDALVLDDLVLEKP